MAESNQITNRNLLSPLNWKLVLKRAPSVSFFIQEINIPDVLLTPAEVPNPLIKYPVSPDHMTYGDLKVIYKVDEDLQNFFEIYSWVKSLGTPNSLDEFKKLSSQSEYSGYGIYSDISVAIQNAQHETRFMIEYKDALPTFIGKMNFVTTAEKIDYITAGVVFKYTSYDIVPYAY